MTKRNRDLARRGTGSLAAGSGQATSSAGWLAAARGGTVVHRVAPAQQACRIDARARAGERDAWPAAAARGGHRRAAADHRAGGRLGPGLRGGPGGRAKLDRLGDAGQRRRRPGPGSSPRCKARRPSARRPAGSSMTPTGWVPRSCWLRPSPPPGHWPCSAGPTRPSALRQPGRRGHQLSASRPRRPGPRAGPGSAGIAGRRGRWSRKHRTTTTLKLPFAAMPATARKELPCPTARKELPCPTRL
jgi:hypothetical protein